LPVPPEVPHEEGASVELLFRPEQVELSAAEPKSGQPVLGRGPVIEQMFSGALRRLRVRLPRLPGTRQVAPTLPFGESGMLIETSLPASAPVTAQELWVSLRTWSILEQAAPRLLVIDAGTGPRTTLELARRLASSVGATITVLGYVPGKSSNHLRKSVDARAREAGFDDFEVSTGVGELPQQIAAHNANALFEFVILPKTFPGSKAGLDPEVIAALEGADLPVIVVPARSQTTTARMLICTRAGEPGKSDVRIGGRLARRLGAQVTLFHVTRSEAQVDPWVSRHLQLASATLNGLEVTNRILTRAGADAAEAIVREAAEYDLVVIGSHGFPVRSVFKRDDITLQVVARSASPALVVPAEA
jgi:nucleotide-binding universal stress UspA family protein